MQTLHHVNANVACIAQFVWHESEPQKKQTLNRIVPHLHAGIWRKTAPCQQKHKNLRKQGRCVYSLLLISILPAKLKVSLAIFEFKG